MPTYPADELEYVGAFAHEPRDEPVLCQAVLRHRPTGRVFYSDGAGEETVTAEETSDNIEEFLLLMEESYVTIFPEPVPYRPNTCMVMWNRIHVTTFGSAFRAMKRYGRIETIRGDTCLRATDPLAALAFYERAAAVLQTHAAYARMLLCPLSGEREARVRAWLVETHPDHGKREADVLVAECVQQADREIFS